MTAISEPRPDLPDFDRFSSSIASAAEAVRRTSETVAATAQEQTTLMVALAESAGQLAEESRAAADRFIITQAQTVAATRDLDDSLELVETLLTSVHQLAELSATTAEAMDDFGRLMSEVGRMTDFVEDVADETQLLALNAAIEAARAGKHGLGFAVVAAEVGRLAKATNESTSSIKTLVVNVQREATETIASVHANAARSAESAPLADLARGSLTVISQLASDLGAAISDAVEGARRHSESAARMRKETGQLAGIAAEQGRQALEAAFATQRLAYYGAEIAYFTRSAHKRSEEHTALRIATLLPRGYPPSRAWEFFATRIEELTEGTLTAELDIPFSGGGELEALLRVRSGELDMVSVTTFVAGALVPVAQLLDLPFVFESSEHAHRLLDGDIGRNILASFGSFGLAGMTYFENGMRHFTNSLRPITHPNDCKKMRIRIQDSVVYLALMHALGASPKSVPFSRVYAALQSSEVDAQENPLPNILGAKLHEVQRHLTLTAHAYNTQIVLANVERLRSLPPDFRDAIETAFAEATVMHRALAAQAEATALEKLRDHLDVRELEPVQREAFVQAARFVWTRMEPLFPEGIGKHLHQRALDSWKDPRHGVERREAARSFTPGDIIAAIDTSVQAVRGTGDRIASQATSQITQLQSLSGHAVEISRYNDACAGRFRILQERCTTALPAITTTRQTVEGLLATIEALAGMAAQSRTALDQFGNSMRQIVEIVALVRSVSERTNLLALNAAIEAARAAEYGIGFQVVAGEVRSLADKTKASTQQIRGVLLDLGERGKTAAQAIAGGVLKAERSAQHARAAQGAFARIEIFAAAAQQSLQEAEQEAIAESQRSYAMYGDYAQMAALVESHAQEGKRAFDVTEELERQRAGLFARR